MKIPFTSLEKELTKLGYDVTGVESSCDHVSRANERKQVASHHNFNTVQLYIDNSAESVANLLASTDDSENICLVSRVLYTALLKVRTVLHSTWFNFQFSMVSTLIVVLNCQIWYLELPQKNVQISLF